LHLTIFERPANFEFFEQSDRTEFEKTSPGSCLGEVFLRASPDCFTSEGQAVRFEQSVRVTAGRLIYVGASFDIKPWAFIVSTSSPSSRG